MNLRNLSDETLLARTRTLVGEERRLTAEILHHLREIDTRKLYAARQLNYASLFEYATRELGYSEAEAQSRISAARLLRELPEIEEKIESGALSLSNLVKAQSFFRAEAREAEPLSREQKAEVLERLEHKSVRECERLLLSMSSNPAALQERTRVVSLTETEIRFAASKELMDKFEQIKGLWAHALPGATWVQLFTRMADLTLEQIDPVAKAERLERRHDERREKRNASEEKFESVGTCHVSREKATHAEEQISLLRSHHCQTKLIDRRSVSGAREVNEQPESETSTSLLIATPAPLEQARNKSSGRQRAHSTHERTCRSRPAIPAAVKHAVWRRDGCCSIIGEDGHRCGSRHGLELDHVIPYAKGGASTVENLRLACRNHNGRLAIEHFGEHR